MKAAMECTGGETKEGKAGAATAAAPATAGTAGYVATAFFFNAFGRQRRCAESSSSHWEAAGDSHDCPKRRRSITAVAAA